MFTGRKLSAQECLNGAPQLGISDDKVDGGGAALGDQRPLSGSDGDGDVTDGTLYEVRITVADGGDLDLSEAEKEIQISAVLGK